MQLLSQTFLHVLYYLALEPKHVQALREEIEPILEEEGWTKAALDRMIKVDSFVRESQRLNPLAAGAHRSFSLCDIFSAYTRPSVSQASYPAKSSKISHCQMVPLFQLAQPSPSLYIPCISTRRTIAIQMNLTLSGSLA